MFGTKTVESKTMKLIPRKFYSEIQDQFQGKYIQQTNKIIEKCKSYNCGPDNNSLLADILDEFLSEEKTADPRFMPSLTEVKQILQLCSPHNSQWGKIKTFSDDFYYLAQTTKPVPYPKYDYIFCDEVQDFNMCQMKILGDISRQTGAKIVCVGDQNQSIYRFRGSTNNPFDELRKVLNNPITTTLNINYRCSPTIIGYVANRTENKMYAGLPKQSGQFVKETERCLLEYVQPGMTVLARHNITLQNIAMRLYEKDIPFQLSKNLKCEFISYIEESHSESETADVNEKNPQKILENWFMNLRKQNSDEDIITKFEKLTTAEIYVTLMTIHKSKGLEFNQVIFIDYEIDVMSDVMKQQELNCKYIAYTRAKQQLYIQKLPEP